MSVCFWATLWTSCYLVRLLLFLLLKSSCPVMPWREAGDVCHLPVWNLRAVIWFHFTISSLVHLPTPIALFDSTLLFPVLFICLLLLLYLIPLYYLLSCSSAYSYCCIWFHFTISSLVYLPTPIALFDSTLLSPLLFICVLLLLYLIPLYYLLSCSSAYSYCSIWFHFTISSLVHLPTPIALSILSLFHLLAHFPDFFFPIKPSILFGKR